MEELPVDIEKKKGKGRTFLDVLGMGEKKKNVFYAGNVQDQLKEKKKKLDEITNEM